MDRIRFIHGANIELNGEKINVPKDTELFLGLPASEITEEGVTEVEYAASSTYNRSLKPNDGKVKWFKDELGQLWVKLYIDVKNLDRKVYKIRCIVIPANRIVFVGYDKEI